MNNLQGKFKVIDFKWGYIIASFDTLRDALKYVSDKGMRADHKRGETDVYAAR